MAHAVRYTIKEASDTPMKPAHLPMFSRMSLVLENIDRAIAVRLGVALSPLARRLGPLCWIFGQRLQLFHQSCIASFDAGALALCVLNRAAFVIAIVVMHV